MKRASILAVWLGYLPIATAQSVFPPPENPQKLAAIRTPAPIVADGRLSEPAWQLAPKAGAFTQVEPNQGDSAGFATEVRVLYDDDYLYIGAFCRDTVGRRGVRVPDLRRDFDYFANDVFGVSLDPFGDRRNAVVFQTNPYGAQRDLQSFDDRFIDRDWDALWRVRTRILDSGWVAEIAIPWQTLRYPRENNTEWGLQMVRIIRRTNELVGWQPFPRAFSPYRMNYAGRLTNLQPPPPGPNLRVQPYLLGLTNRNYQSDAETATSAEVKIGGEVKWAVNPNTVIDATVNTDFAQADVDRQVNNLTRFSVFFPERRPFFLENASLFAAGSEGEIQPFFSRRIGLDPEAATPLPIDGGLRLVRRTPESGIGGLFVRQRGLGNQPAAWFGVGRYSKNLGKQNRLGGLITYRHDERLDSVAAADNVTASVDGFYRFSDPLSFTAMVSASTTRGRAGEGLTAFANLRYDSNWLYAFFRQSVVTQGYTPGVGFVAAPNSVNTNPGFYFNYRPRWKPKFIRAFEPGIFYNMYHRSSDRVFQQAELTVFPIWVRFQSDAIFEMLWTPTWQYTDEPLSILGTIIPAGNYHYQRYKVNYQADRSQRFSYSALYEFGGFYTGSLRSFQLSARYSPIPHISVGLRYERNYLRDIDSAGSRLLTELLAPEVRLALNPRVQLIAFYQGNIRYDANRLDPENQATRLPIGYLNRDQLASNRNVWNVRLSWEFQPLSFLYLVYNDNTLQSGLPNTVASRQFGNQQLIAKLTYLKQF